MLNLKKYFFPNPNLNIHLDLDEDEALRKKAQRQYRLNIIEIPSLRILGFLLIGFGVFLHNKYVLFSFNAFSYFILLSLLIGYCLISWILLYFFFEKIKAIDLGVVFLGIDIFFIVLAIYFSGGDKSLAFFLVIVRVADQVNTSFKRVLVFAHLTTVGYIALVFYMIFVEKRPVLVGPEIVKIIVIYLLSMFVALAARTSEVIRNRTRDSMKLARNLIIKLEKNTEQLIDSKQKAEKANKAKDSFLANMSHELRTPLNHIIGFTDLLLTKDFGEINETQEEYLQDIIQSGSHLLFLINEVLDHAKTEANMLELNQLEIPIQPFISGCLGLFSQKTQHNGLRFDLVINSSTQTINADEIRLKQILFNLLSNAVKFTPENGKISIQVTDYADEGIEISVSDTGIGIDERDMDRIFMPFEQAVHSKSSKSQGTGLGLSLTKRLVELHGGKIWVESQGIGYGSTFHFVLPI